MHRGHLVLYRPRPPAARAILEFFGATFPRLVRRHWRSMAVAAALFFVPLFALIGTLQLRPELAHAVLGPEQLAEVEEMYDPAEHEDRLGRDEQTDLMMFGFYVWNNVSIGFRTFASGLLVGIGAVLWAGMHYGILAETWSTFVGQLVDGTINGTTFVTNYCEEIREGKVVKGGLIGAIRGGLAGLTVRNSLLLAMMTLTAVVVVQGYIGVSKVGEAHEAAESLYQQRLKPAVTLAEKVYCICASTAWALPESALPDTLTRSAVAVSLTATVDAPGAEPAAPEVPSLPPQPNSTAVARESAVSLNDFIVLVFIAWVLS